MSPEQARARPVDKRTDIWAFGCVLYEMLTGRPAFPGATVSDTIAKILEREPDWQALPVALPERGLELLQRCLAKDLAERRRDMHDIRLEVEQVLRSLHSQSSRVTPVAGAPATRRRHGWLWAAAALAALTLAAGTVWYRLPVAPLQIMRLNMDVSPAQALTGLT
jgi:eukaryotic-like serine/threonine-protein kinase